MKYKEFHIENHIEFCIANRSVHKVALKYWEYHILLRNMVLRFSDDKYKELHN